MNEFTHDYVRIDGQRLHCVIAGAGKPVLLIPGWPQTWYAWRHVMAALAAQAPARGWRLQAVHVHHGLSPHADAWAAFCGDLCAGLGVPLQVHRVSLPEARPAGLEATARAARYLKVTAFTSVRFESGRAAGLWVTAMRIIDTAGLKRPGWSRAVSSLIGFAFGLAT